jgi:hypothetical protein
LISDEGGLFFVRRGGIRYKLWIKKRAAAKIASRQPEIIF